MIMTYIRWRLLTLAVLASFVAYVLRINLSIASPAIVKDFGLNEVQFGGVLAAFAWGYAAFQVPGGVLGARLGARRSMTWLLTIWTVITLLSTLIPATRGTGAWIALVAFFLVRLLLGICQAPLFPILSGLFTPSWFPPGSWALPNGLTSTGLTLGAAAAGPVIAGLVGAIGWRWAFVVTAPVAGLVAVWWWWDIRDDPAQHPAVSTAELNLIRAGRPAEAKAGPNDWRQVLRNPDIVGITFSYFCMNYVFYLFFNWFFYYLVEVRHLSNQAGGNFSGAQWIVGAATAFLGGWFCDWLTSRVGPRRGPQITVMAGLLVAAPLLVAGALSANPAVAVTLLAASFGATQLTEGAYWAAATRVGGRHAPAATGLMNTGGNLVGGFGALMVPLVASAFGWTVAVSTGALFAVLGALPWLWIRADRTFDGDQPA